jgi:uncharacterized protein
MPRHNELVTTRDGVRLATDVYLPAGDGPFPAILQRTPYGKLDGSSAVYARWCAGQGYAGVVQDVRGRHDSGGEWHPYDNSEDADAFDTLDWIVAQPWSDGAVACAGGSYDAYTGLMAGLSGHPALKAIVARVPATGLYHHHFYCGGVFCLERLWWGAHVNGRVTKDYALCDELIAAEEDLLLHLPVAEIGDLFAIPVPWWRTWLEHDGDDDFWRRLEVAHHFDRVRVPVYHVGGWYDDLFVPVPPENYLAALRAHPDAPPGSQRLLMGPWAHMLNERSEFGGIDHGPEAVIELWEREKRWLDRWVRGIGDGLGDEPPVRLFVMGDDAWRSYAAWPPETTRPLSLHLRAGGGLSVEAPGDEPPDRYRYDPLSPTPKPWNFGEAIPPDDLPSWPLDPGPRADRLLYASSPLAEPLTVIGNVLLRLHAATSAPDTDWFAWVAWEEPDTGRVRLLTNGYALRARFRNGFDSAEPLPPGEVVQYEIDLGATARVLPAGARIHCCIQSAAAPWFVRNLNTGGDNHRETVAIEADQTVFHDAARPSALVLMVETVAQTR